MTMLKNVMFYSVESSSTTISSCSPTSATSTSPEGSSLLYEKANKGLGLAHDFMVRQMQLRALNVAVGYTIHTIHKFNLYIKPGQHIYQRTYDKVQDSHSRYSTKCIPLTKMFQGHNVITIYQLFILVPITTKDN